MIKSFFNRTTLAAGCAVFSMFFGAGNLIFPLTLGRDAGDQTLWAVLGMLLTAVAGPVIGLISIVLFEGDYRAFFDRIGRIPGFFATFLVVGIMGPFAVVPRCVVLAYSAVDSYLPGVDLSLFSLLAGVIIFFCCIDRHRIIDILGYILSPTLLILLTLIISKSLFVNEGMPMIDTSPLPMFLQGLEVGYDTMDLMGSIFFSSALFLGLKQKLSDSEGKWDRKQLTSISTRAGLIGGVLIALVYVGLSFGAAFRSAELMGAPPERLLVTLASHTYGSVLRGAAGAAVSLACLTTAVTLIAVFSDFFSKQVCQQRISYKSSLVFSIVVTVVLSTLGFAPIMAIIHPVIYALYPATIMLTLCNISHKLWGWQWVKAPVYLTLACTLGRIFFLY